MARFASATSCASKASLSHPAGYAVSGWHDLANFKSRLRALEAKVAEEGLILTEAQVQALERKKLDDEVCGEIETAHPGYLGSQDTFYVGTLKGVGRIYPQTYVDTYANLAGKVRRLN